MAAEPPILAAKPREWLLPILLATSPPVFTLHCQNFTSHVNNPASYAGYFKAATSHSPRDFAARIHSPLSKFYVAREQSRQLRRLTLSGIVHSQYINIITLTRGVLNKFRTGFPDSLSSGVLRYKRVLKINNFALETSDSCMLEFF